MEGAAEDDLKYPIILLEGTQVLLQICGKCSYNYYYYWFSAL